LTLTSARLFQLFKYMVYALLSYNVYLFWGEESAAATLQFTNGVGMADLIEAYAATIDTAAWVVLLLMFELETWVLDDRHFTPPVRWSLHALRTICYAFIVYAFYGYIANMLFVSDVLPVDGVASACSIASDGWSWAVTLDQYEAITTSNCAALADAGPYFRFRDMAAMVDGPGLVAIQRLAWVDVINGAVWLLVVLVLEIDVRLQERSRFEGLALWLSNAAKFVLYGTLLLAAVYWGIEGDFVDFWDAFLWLVAFVFIELNVFEWRQEALEAAETGYSAVISK